MSFSRMLRPGLPALLLSWFLLGMVASVVMPAVALAQDEATATAQDEAAAPADDEPVASAEPEGNPKGWN